MAVVLSRSRWLLVCLVCLTSMVGGGLLVFRLVRPETVSRLSTHELVALLGLLLLPALTVWAFVFERRTRRRLEEVQRIDIARERDKVRGREAPQDASGEDESGGRSVRSWARDSALG